MILYLEKSQMMGVIKNRIMCMR